MSTIAILTYLFGVIFILSALLFSYYALRNIRLMRGSLGQKLMAAGSVTSIIAFSFHAIQLLFFPGAIMPLPMPVIWLMAILLIVFGGILRAEDSRRVQKISWIESIRVLASAKYCLIGILILICCNIPLTVWLFFHGYYGITIIDWFHTVGAFTLTIAFASLVLGERRLYLSTQLSAAVAGSKEIDLLKSDMLAARGYEILTNTFLARVKPAIGENLIRKTLTDYFEYNPILFEDCILKEDGSIDVTPMTRNLDRISAGNGVQTVCTLFARLNSKVMNLYGAVTSPELARKALADSYMAVKKQYRDIPVLFDILRTMPEGVLENEKLALLSKEELEAKVSQRTQELEEILKELAEARDYLDSVIKSMIDILIVADLEGRIQTINIMAGEILGYREDELIGQPLNKLFTQARSSLPRGKVLEKLQRGGTIRGYEVKITTKDGRMIPVDMNASPIMQRGELKAIQIVARDITERKQTEEELRSSREQLRDLARHMESARERERTRIARELHDQMGQALTALKMDLSHLNKTLSQDQITLREKITSMLELTDTAIKTVKRLATELRPGILDDLGLTAAIEWEAEEFQQRTGIECELSLYPEDIKLDEVLSTAIFRVLQEALTNVARHAMATKVKISLEEKDGKLELEVIDNGRGVTEKQVSARKSLGLVGMRERVLPWQGKVEISGVCGEGTTVAVRIPLSQEVKIP